MSNSGFNLKPMILLQTVLWYFLGGWFLVAALLLSMSQPLGSTMAVVGPFLVLAAAPARILVMAEQFRKARLYRYCLLSYLLLLILVGTAVIRAILR